MSSTIEINNSGYRESEQIENWAAVYAKKAIKEHRENAGLDHPDGSVTYDKLAGDVKAKFTAAQNDAKSALDTVENVSENCIKTSSDALAKAISAQSVASRATADAMTALESANGAVRTAESALGESAAAKAVAQSASQAAQTVQSQLPQKQDKEPEWQKITDTTLTEDAAFKQTLPDNCVGVRVRIRAPKEIALPAGQLYPRSGATWIYTLYIPGYNANTAQDKLITAEWTQKHGTWVYDCKVRTGAGNFNGSIIYSFPEIKLDSAYKYSLSSLPTLDELNYDAEFKAGTIIKVWGLIKE